MNSVQMREHLINQVLQQYDAAVRVIEELQKKVAELQKQLDQYTPKDSETKA